MPWLNEYMCCMPKICETLYDRLCSKCETVSTKFRTKCTSIRTGMRNNYTKCCLGCEIFNNRCKEVCIKSKRKVQIDWDNLETNNHFLLCIPLNAGAVIIALLGILYSLFGLYYFVTITVNLDEWKYVYRDKIDMLAYLYIFFIFVSLQSLPSIVLLIGVLMKKQKPIVIYLHCSILHLVCIWSITLGVTVYCMFINEECFMGSGQGQAVFSLVFAMFYTFVWIYIIYCVNSFRKLTKLKRAKIYSEGKRVRMTPRVSAAVLPRLSQLALKSPSTTSSLRRQASVVVPTKQQPLVATGAPRKPLAATAASRQRPAVTTTSQQSLAATSSTRQTRLGSPSKQSTTRNG